MKVIAIYDFSAQPGTGEISIVKDEIITVTRQDIGEGWWEGINRNQEKGLFPAQYVTPVEPLDDPWNEPLPPPPPSMPTNGGGDQHQMQQQSGLRSFPVPIQQPQPVTNLLAPGNNANNDYNPEEDGWDDDEWDTDSESAVGDLHTPSISSHQAIPPLTNNVPVQAPAIKRRIGLFSSMSKSVQDYILGLKKINVEQNETVHIVLENGVLMWAPTYFSYTVSVENPKKESKMKGLKSFIAYQLTPSDSGIPVSRRYKHFDWLHERLQDKFAIIPIPSLPDKQISGRYEKDFIQTRLIQLQSWVNRISRHPVLGQSTIWKHFITCKDEKQWKTGKRRAEKDELVGGYFFYTIQVPEDAKNDHNTDHRLEQFFRYTNKLDESTKNTYNVAQEIIKHYQSFYRKEFSKVSGIFSNLSEAFEASPLRKAENKELIDAFNYTSETYETIGKMFEEQHWTDFGPLSNLMHEYRGLLTSWPEIHQINKGAMNLKKENRKAYDENRLDDKSLKEINKRADVVTYATLAEMNHFEQERINDFNQIMRTFLTGQLELYKAMVANIENALKKFPEQ